MCLTETAIDDIAVLNSIRNKLHAHELLDKLIYDTYVSKPVLEMVKRVLKGESPSGIYKITNLSTIMLDNLSIIFVYIITTKPI